MDLLPEQIPLLIAFNTLRDRHGLPLGVDDYLLLLHALQAGFGVETLGGLEELCCTLWAKSPADVRAIRSVFKESTTILPSAEPSPSVSFERHGRAELKHQEDEEPAEIPSETFKEDIIPSDINPDESVQIVQTVRRHRSVEEPIPHTRFVSSSDYFPVTRRQMKQSWRHLRRLIREGPKVELDIPTTTERIGREGILSEPVLLPRRVNRASGVSHLKI